MNYRFHVSVRADHLHDGRVIPRMFRMSEDSPIVAIDKILEVKQTTTRRYDGCGLRYICRVDGKIVHLFYSQGLWFIDG